MLVRRCPGCYTVKGIGDNFAYLPKTGKYSANCHECTALIRRVGVRLRRIKARVGKVDRRRCNWDVLLLIRIATARVWHFG